MSGNKDKTPTEMCMELIGILIRGIPYDCLDDVIQIAKTEKAIRHSRGEGT